MLLNPQRGAAGIPFIKRTTWFDFTVCNRSSPTALAARMGTQDAGHSASYRYVLLG